MKLLAVDSSAKTASVAVFDSGNLISECYVNNGLTHSCTLLPMINNALKQINLGINDIDLYAVNSGPGSFTGIRIGCATVKGLAASSKKPVCAVSTLESVAYNFIDEDCYICPVMDARCNQVYTALFKSEKGNIIRIKNDSAENIDILFDALKSISSKVIIAGDGAFLFEKYLSDDSLIKIAADNRRYQTGYGTGLAALKNNDFQDSSCLCPVYLRPSQAERELKIRRD